MNKSQLTDQQIELSKQFNLLIKQATTVFIDPTENIKKAVICLLGKGHLLIEDHPGVGKTTLAKTLSKLLTLQQKRIQFTYDLLPLDLIGYSIFDETSKIITFKKGPLFTELLLADELNRAHPKTQSALLQAMEEKIVSVDGHNYSLPEIYFIIATQNPLDQIGTHQLPESQIDRFFMALRLNYLEPTLEVNLLMNASSSAALQIDELTPLINHAQIIQAQKDVEDIFIDQDLVEFIVAFLNRTRLNQTKNHTHHTQLCTPLSTRAGRSWILAAKALAYLELRSYVLPSDVITMAYCILSHRISPLLGLKKGEEIIAQIFQQLQQSPKTQIPI